jgi:hypothetical protein
VHVAFSASIASFAVAMFTFDAFAFTQVTFVFFVLLALGSALVFADEPVFVPESAPTSARARRGLVPEASPALSSE